MEFEPCGDFGGADGEACASTASLVGFVVAGHLAGVVAAGGLVCREFVVALDGVGGGSVFSSRKPGSDIAAFMESGRDCRAGCDVGDAAADGGGDQWSAGGGGWLSQSFVARVYVWCVGFLSGGSSCGDAAGGVGYRSRSGVTI